jgi:hypothetical protein
MCAGYQRLKHQHQQFITIMRSSSIYQYHQHIQEDLEDLSTNVIKIDEDYPHS